MCPGSIKSLSHRQEKTSVVGSIESPSPTHPGVEIIRLYAQRRNYVTGSF